MVDSTGSRQEIRSLPHTDSSLFGKKENNKFSSPQECVSHFQHTCAPCCWQTWTGCLVSTAKSYPGPWWRSLGSLPEEVGPRSHWVEPCSCQLRATCALGGKGTAVLACSHKLRHCFQTLAKLPTLHGLAGCLPARNLYNLWLQGTSGSYFWKRCLRVEKFNLWHLQKHERKTSAGGKSKYP